MTKVDGCPGHLLQTYPTPAYRGETWGDLITHSRRLMALNQRHNADKRALRKLCAR